MRQYACAVEGRVAVFLDEVAAWAARQADVSVILLVGSQARVDSPADEFSDVDLVLFVENPPRYLQKTGWLRELGEPLLTFVEPTAVGGFEERRVLFDNDLDVDFAFLPPSVATAPPAEAISVLGRGFRVLYGEFAFDAVETGGVASVLTQAMLDQLSHDFWYHVLWAAKKLRRGELLLAKQVCDGYLLAQLVELARWRAQGRDTWHGYRFFERWAGKELIAALPATFARYEVNDIARALRATADVFGDLEEEVARRFDLAVTVDRREILRRLDALVAPYS